MFYKRSWSHWPPFHVESYYYYYFHGTLSSMELHDEVALTAYKVIFLGFQGTSLLGHQHFARWIISAKQDSGMFYFERLRSNDLTKFVRKQCIYKVWTRMRWCTAPTMMLEFFNSSPLHAEANPPSKYRISTLWTRPNVWTRQRSEYLPNQQYLLRNDVC